jgi:CheY-like chemotaxis protein
MIVDDEADARELIEDMLRGAGARVVSAARARGDAQVHAGAAGPAAQRHRHARRERLRPGAAGARAADRIRRRRAGDRAHRLRAARGPLARARAGFQMHLAKPVEQAELLARLYEA